MDYSRALIVVLACLFILGCNKENVRTVYVDKPVPYIVVPEPPQIKRPDLDILKLTPEQVQKDGEIAKSYVITVGQLVVYAELLEKVVLKYGELAKMNQQDRDALKQRVEQNIILSGYTKTYPEALAEEVKKLQK